MFCKFGVVESEFAAYCCSIIGWVHAEAGDLPTALTFCTRATEMHSKIGTSYTFMGTQGGLALAYVKERLGDGCGSRKLRRTASTAGRNACLCEFPLVMLAPSEYYCEGGQDYLHDEVFACQVF